MTHTPDIDRDRADADAAAWLVRLAEAPDDARLRARFEAWRDKDPLNAAIWARTSRAYRMLGKHGPPPRAPWPRPRQPPVGRKGVRLAVAAAALCAGLALALLPGMLLRFQADLVTSTAELGSLVLPDGSEVQLAPESAIGTAFSRGERRVRLLKGEAYFSVAPDPAHPFRVFAGDATVTVLGTAFDVRLDRRGTTVAVEHGNVAVQQGNPASPFARRLGAGDWLVVSNLRPPVLGHESAPEVAAWRRGQLVVRDRPASEIVEALRPYYHGLIVLRNPVFETHRVSGIYDLRDPAATLRALADSYDAKLMQISPWITVVAEK